MDLGEVGLLLVTRGEEEARRAVEDYVRAADAATRALEENAQRVVRAQQAQERQIQRDIKVMSELVREAAGLRRAYEDLSASFSKIEKAHLEYYRTEQMLNKALAANVITETEHARVLELVTQRLQEVAAAVRVEDEEARIALQERANAELERAGANYDAIVAALDPAYAANLKYAESLKRINEASELGAISEKQRLDAIQMVTNQFNKELESPRAKQLEREQQEAEKLSAANQQLANDYARLTASVNPAVRAQQLYDSAVKTLDRSLEKGIITQQQYNTTLADVKVQMERTGHTVNQFGQVMTTSERDFAKFARGGMQQLGYQVGDFAVQIQGGTSALVAFGQQGAQLAGIFGATGAVVGAGIAIVTALAHAYVTAQGEGKNLSQTVNDMDSSFQELNTTLDNLSSIDLGGEFGDLTKEIRSMTEAALALDSAMALKNMMSTFDKLKEDYIEPGIMQRLSESFSVSFGDPFASTAGGMRPGGAPMAAMDDALNLVRAENFEKLGFDMGYETFVGYQKAIDEASKSGDLEQVTRILIEMFVDAAPDIESAQRIIASGGFEILDAYRQIAVATAEANAKMKEYRETGGIKTQMVIAEERGHMEAINSATDHAAKAAYRRYQEESKIVDVLDTVSGKMSQQRGHMEAIRSAQDDSARAAYRQWQEQEKAQREAEKLSDFIMDAYKNGQDLAGLSMDGKIIAAADAAKILAERLGISVGFANELSRLNTMTTDERRIYTGVQSGALPDAALNTIDMGPNMGETETFPIDYVTPTPSLNTGSSSDGEGGGSSRDPLADLREQIKLQNELVGLTDEMAQVYETLGSDREKYSKMELDAIAAEIKAYEDKNRAIEAMQSVADTVQSSVVDGLMSMVDGTKTVEDSFREMARSIIAQLYEVLVVQQLVGSWNAQTREGTGIAGFIMKGIGNLVSATQARGGAWSGGNEIAFANGGVVSSPTYFGMSGGRTGLMGEAGPEAILPLKRSSSGRLGVTLAGGGTNTITDNFTLNLSFNINGSDEATVKREIDKAIPRIADVAKAAVADSRRRGGQMRATFG